MKHPTKAVLQNENDRLRAALADVLDVCGRERRLLKEWPRAVGEVQCIARLALQGGGAIGEAQYLALEALQGRED